MDAVPGATGLRIGLNGAPAAADRWTWFDHRVPKETAHSRQGANA